MKIVGLLKRRPGMTRDDFIAYYETHHARLGERNLAGLATRYERRYLVPLGSDGDDPDPPFDVILELWFDRPEAFAQLTALIAQPEMAAMIMADEERLFDRSRTCFFAVDERRSALARPGEPRA